MGKAATAKSESDKKKKKKARAATVSVNVTAKKDKGAKKAGAKSKKHDGFDGQWLLRVVEDSHRCAISVADRDHLDLYG